MNLIEAAKKVPFLTSSVLLSEVYLVTKGVQEYLEFGSKVPPYEIPALMVFGLMAGTGYGIATELLLRGIGTILRIGNGEVNWDTPISQVFSKYPWNISGN
ncbi:MAG: hypothetical protein KBD73_04070 [Candidatus Magasanikbacteria bacterium]|nr:hypothetical protein [Candidatus Magasanikbacteria bacterium]